jgi:orotidine-5'-phosphate decarboxylase
LASGGAFHQALHNAWARQRSSLCVGLDPDPARLPHSVVGAPDAIFTFCREIVDATADLVCSFKPQIAYFASQGAEDQLERLCHHIRDAHPHVVLVLDAKRGDIGSTAEHYAREAFDRYGAHAVTVNPYLGTDALEPFLRHPGTGTIVLCRTSNPGAGDFQDLMVDGSPLYAHVARRAATEWATMGDVGLVVGATYPSELAEVRSIVGDLPLLVPGIGAQGGDLESSVRAGRVHDDSGPGPGTGPATGLMVNSSRAVLYASSGDDFAAAARAEAERTRDAINAVT